jgi:alkylation response protein AidB-like acyl-CoA dehydrogenase
MNFDLSEDQKLLVDTAAAFVRKESPIARVRAMREDPIGYSNDVWEKMGELGWLGIPFPESLGGFGGRFADAALILEKLGTTLVPSLTLHPSSSLARRSWQREARIKNDGGSSRSSPAK